MFAVHPLLAATAVPGIASGPHAVWQAGGIVRRPVSLSPLVGLQIAAAAGAALWAAIFMLVF